MAHARQDIATVTGMGIDQAEEFLRSREGLLAYAKFDNMERLAGAHGKSFMDLARDSQRTITMDVDGKSAATWGLPGAGHYSVSWDRKGGYLFTDRKSGSQYQVGVFGHSGRSEFVHDEKGTIIFHGSNATHGDREERRSFKGNIDGHEFTDAAIVRTGNTFTVTGHVRGGGWVTVDGHVSTGPDGKTRYVSQSFRDTGGGKFTPESAFSQLVTYHSVPEAALRDTQTKTAFARALVEQMRYLRGESYNLSKISSVGLSGHLSTARSSDISSKSGDEKVGGGKAGASVGLTSNVQRRTMVSEDVDIQFREVMKILDKHDNTTEGRKTAGSDLLDFYDNSAGNSSTRETSMLSGGSWKRKDRAR